jgi:hypothetical protein
VVLYLCQATVMSIRLLVCGDRHYDDWATLSWTLDQFRWTHFKAGDAIDVVIEGEAPGADTMAREWAEKRGIPVDAHPADWTKYGKAAGPIRNQEMLDCGPTHVLAFHNDFENSRGTKDMVARARKAGVFTQVVAVRHGPAS